MGKTTLQLICALMCTSTLWADGKAPEPGKPDPLAKLVRQLGSRSYRLRAEAEGKILKLGHAAEDALKKGISSSDPEISQRSQILLVKIRRAEEVEQIKRFLSKKDDDNKKDFPGWKKFSAMVGDDNAARTFFVTLLKQEREILQIVEKGGAGCSDKFKERTEEIYKRLYQRNGIAIQGNNPVFQEELSALLLLSAEDGLNLSYTNAWHFFRFFSQTEIQKAMKAGKEDVFRRLFLAWVRGQKNDMIVEQLLRRSTYFEKKDLLALALRIAKEGKPTSKGAAFAFPIIAQHGKKEDVKLMQRFLDSTTSVCGFGIGGGLSGSTQVRDVALSMILHLEGQNHSDYGFTYTRSPSGDHLKFNASFQGFTNETDRKAAFARYESWKTSTGKPAPKEKPKP